jgi:hypothetical protein
MRRDAARTNDGLESLEGLEVERTSGVFLRGRRVVRDAPPCGAEDVARAVHAVTRTWAAVLLVHPLHVAASASVFPAPARPDDSGFSLVMRLSAWLPQAGDVSRALAVPVYVRKWMPVDAALVIPIQTLATVGWIAVPQTGSARELVRRVEAIASGVALDLEGGERKERLSSLANGR